MPKIFQINVTANWGSTGHIAEEIGQYIIKNGWDSYIAYGRQANVSKSRLIKIGTELEIRNHVFQTRLFDYHGLCSEKSTKELINQISEIKPDIIHLHNIHGYYLNYRILFDFLSKSNVPIIWTLHDCWPFTGHCAYYSYSQCSKWKTECHSCPNLNSYPKTCFVDRSRKNYRLKKESFLSVNNMILVPVSRWLKEDVAESFLNRYRIKIIHNGINLDIFKQCKTNKEKYCLSNEFLILGVASIWEKRKGLDDFIKLASRLNPDEKIILVGLSRKQKRNLPQNIIGFQRTENISQLIELYSAADIFLNLTWEDNFPTTNLEALACGTPVITYITGGSVEAIDDKTGIVVEQGDINGLFDAIREIKVKGRSCYSQACRNRVEMLFNKNDRYAEYIELYKEILKIK